MVKARRFGGLREGSVGLLRFTREKLRTRLPIPKVNESPFVVVATEGWKSKGFIIQVGCLDNPEFLKSLKQAEEELGFSQEGAVAIPCQPDELPKTVSVRGKKMELHLWFKVLIFNFVLFVIFYLYSTFC